MRVGIGYDVHKMVDNRKLILGGITLEYEQGLLGHSDADVLVHAIMDALLGAAGLGDIGRWFPDSSSEFEDISSLVLLESVREKLVMESYSIGNIDCVIIAQAPKVSPYIMAMEETIAKVLQIDVNQINIKATTTEKLGFVGKKEGIAAKAIALLL